MMPRDGRYSRWVGGDNPFEVIADVPWVACRRQGTVQRPFRHDGGSTGRARHVGFPPVGDEMERGYLVHDDLYRNPRPGISRRKADAIMRAIHKQDGVCWARRMAAWWAVRRFGGNAWRRHRQYQTQFAEMH